MTELGPLVREVIRTFDGTQVVAIDRGREGWPPYEDMQRALALYVSLDLRCWCLMPAKPAQPGEPEPLDPRKVYAEDVTQGDKDGKRAYRRLGMRWYAYLYQAMQREQSDRLREGTTGAPLWQQKRARFNALWLWAKERVGKAQLVEAENLRLPLEYRPPVIVGDPGS